ncbi:MAG: hypothetical protein K2Q06_15345, partial [Parvularculaceae bacterium]|nr:hypothetical protein [Parvularculaceae bacterium]
TQDEIETLRRGLEERAKLRVEIEKPRDDDARRFAEPYARALGSAGDDLVRRLARGDLSGVRDFARRFKDIFLDAAIDPIARSFSSFLQNAFSGLFTSFQGGGGPFTPGIAGANPANAGGASAGGGGLGGFLSPQFLSLGLGAAASSATGSFAPLAIGALGSLGGARLGAGLSSLALSSGLGNNAAFNFAAKRLVSASSLANVGGGLVGGVASSLLFGNSTASQVGSTIGGIVGNVIPIPFLGSLIGSLLGGAIGSLFAGKPSNKVGQVVFDPSSGRVVGTATRDQTEDSLKNLQIAQKVQTGTANAVRAVLGLTGGSIGGLLLNVSAGNRNDILVGRQGANGEQIDPKQFDKSEAGLAEATRYAIGLALEKLQDADEALATVAKGLFKSGAEVEDIVDRLGRLKSVLADPNEFVDPLKQRIDAVKDAFEGLDRSTGAVKDAFEKAVGILTKNLETEARQAIQQQDNPKLFAIEEILKQQEARRKSIEELTALGGKVDGALLSEFQRRQLLSQFNAGERFAQTSDPVKFQLDQLLKSQAQEREAFRRAIAGSKGLLTEADFLTLIRAQEAERFQAFKGLSDEDKARLSGRAGDFEDLTRQYALAVERLIAETEKLREGFEAERQRLAQVVSTRAGEVETLAEAIRKLDARNRLQAPGRLPELFRADLEDLGRRALSEDEATKAAARAALPQAVDDYLAALERVFASGPETAAGARFSRDLLDQVRERAANEKTTAEKQLEQLELLRVRLDAIRDLLAAPRLDVAALVEATKGLDGNNPVVLAALRLAEIEARSTAQTERLIAALAALSPADVGLV